jgi:hypothetical protein
MQTAPIRNHVQGATRGGIALRDHPCGIHHVKGPPMRIALLMCRRSRSVRSGQALRTASASGCPCANAKCGPAGRSGGPMTPVGPPSWVALIMKNA